MEKSGFSRRILVALFFIMSFIFMGLGIWMRLDVKAKADEGQLSVKIENAEWFEDADTVIFLYRSEYYKTDDAAGQDTSIAEIIIGKHRNGPTGTVELSFRPEYTSFEDLDTIHYETPPANPASAG